MRVRVGTWSLRRELREGSNALEVATCRECDACMGRLMFVSERLARRGVPFHWLKEDNRVFVQLEQVDQDRPLKDYLSDVLGLAIH